MILFRHYAYSLLLAIVATGCAGTEQNIEQKTDTAAPNVANTIATQGLELVAQSDCFTCHKVLEPSVGPAYQAIANRYDTSENTINTLGQKVIEGGSGNWGPAYMTPHPQLSKKDATLMVQYILSLKKN